MPLPTLPTKLGTLLSEKDDSVILADPPVPLDEPESPPASPNAPARKAAVEPRAKKTAPAKTAPAAPAAKTAPASAAKPAPSKSAAASPVQQPKPTTNTSGKRTRLAPTQRKLFVLDTNVLLHDSNSLFKFEEHDIFLPMMVLEELDHQKKACQKWLAMRARLADPWKVWWAIMVWTNPLI